MIRSRDTLRDGTAKMVLKGSEEWLPGLPDDHLDWVYLDASHYYKDTIQELQLLYQKVKPGGLVIGDDWQEEPNTIGYSVYRAVSEILSKKKFELIFGGKDLQWAIRRNQAAKR